ncbi:hypothetical protein CC1G_07303 [Coprinopsis cinerea okayama7|uniref:Uncharacterized protein n=1 Tax=Coprinopsis cinerea (strain Okayama-7 / 130 / ATCC MYA-4618 / FGSC 9003) TaxID=240176 RepID=A8NNN4_COPC7|nr:hypothetical protein CC1G_07303 [Coprinopsis cinerea okayama7\|eukprot:XP_001835161.1 hypothetical protein CC1G_07303 [Coprinopsis cinerea okayama7\
MRIYLLIALGLAHNLVAGPAYRLGSRQEEALVTSPDNMVSINGPDNYCLIVPKTEYTDVGESEFPGGTTTYCSPLARYDLNAQGELPQEFWTSVDYTTGSGVNGVRYTQRAFKFYVSLRRADKEFVCEN